MSELPTPTFAATVHLDHVRAGIDETRSRATGRLDVDVAACPGWTIGDVLGHQAWVFDWATAQLRAADPASGVRTDFVAGDDPAGAFETTAAALVEVLEGIDTSTPVWTFGPLDSTAAFWFRRLAHEVQMHLVDIAAALGDPIRLDPAFAVDGINEFGQTFLAAAGTRGITGTGQTVHLHATDVDDDVAAQVGAGEWMYTFTPDGVEVGYEHGKGDMAARGSAFDLLCFVWNRRPVDLATFGDTDVTEFWPSTVAI